MRYQLILLAVVALLATRSFAGLASSADDESTSERKGRWFLNSDTVTQTLLEKRFVTQYAPWSCVVVEPSVPPCRHVRQLDPHRTRAVPIMASSTVVVAAGGRHPPLRRQGREHAYYDDQGYAGLSPSMDAEYYPTPPLAGGWVHMTMPSQFTGREAANAVAAPVNADGTINVQPAPGASALSQPQPQPQGNNIQGTPTVVAPVVAATAATSVAGWAEWFGFRGPAHTVTETLTTYETTKFIDPDTVVTFSFRGCQPSKLPFNLPYCHDQKQSPFPSAAPGTLPTNKNSPAVEVVPIGVHPVPSASNTTTTTTTNTTTTTGASRTTTTKSPPS